MPMLWLGYCGMPRRVLDYPASLGGWHAISSAGHLLSVAAILAFFIMIYDSIRQGKPSIRNNFGAGRLNTRLSFYFFEINRLSFIQKKASITTESH
jgi:cytochrome c oxidase subunit 1